MCRPNKYLPCDRKRDTQHYVWRQKDTYLSNMETQSMQSPALHRINLLIIALHLRTRDAHGWWLCCYTRLLLQVNALPHITRLCTLIPISYCTSSLQLLYISKFISNKLHLSIDRWPLLHVLAIIYSHQHNTPNLPTHYISSNTNMNKTI